MSETTTAPQKLNLQKGENLDLTKSHPGLNLVAVGMGWDAAPSGGQACDLDAFALCVDANGKCSNWPQNVLYFGSPKNASGKLAILSDALVHTGDNLTGAGDGDDETIIVDLSKIPADVDRVVFCANIYEATSRRQNFGQVKNCSIHCYDSNTKEELVKYDLQEDFAGKTALILGELYRRDGEWKFRALGEGVDGDINAVAAKYQ